MRALLRPGRAERDLHDELAFHLERETRKLIDEGMTPSEARDAAQARFGSTTLAADECRDERGTALDRQHYPRYSVHPSDFQARAAGRADDRRDRGARSGRGRGPLHHPQCDALPHRYGPGHHRDLCRRAAAGQWRKRSVHASAFRSVASGNERLQRCLRGRERDRSARRRADDGGRSRFRQLLQRRPGESGDGANVQPR